MVVSFRDPIIQEKVIAHADYKVHRPLPKKPDNPNRWGDWVERCQKIKQEVSPHNAKLYKQIWAELNSSTEE